MEPTNVCNGYLGSLSLTSAAALLDEELLELELDELDELLEELELEDEELLLEDEELEELEELEDELDELELLLELDEELELLLELELEDEELEDEALLAPPGSKATSAKPYIIDVATLVGMLLLALIQRVSWIVTLSCVTGVANELWHQLLAPFLVATTYAVFAETLTGVISAYTHVSTPCAVTSTEANTVPFASYKRTVRVPVLQRRPSCVICPFTSGVNLYPML